MDNSENNIYANLTIDIPEDPHCEIIKLSQIEIDHNKYNVSLLDAKSKSKSKSNSNSNSDSKTKPTKSHFLYDKLTSLIRCVGFSPKLKQ